MGQPYLLSRGGSLELGVGSSRIWHYAFFSKLKRLKLALRDWNQTTFGNIFGNIAVAEEEFRICEVKLEKESSDEARVQWSQAQARLLKKLADEEMFWKQKS